PRALRRGAPRCAACWHRGCRQPSPAVGTATSSIVTEVRTTHDVTTIVFALLTKIRAVRRRIMKLVMFATTVTLLTAAPLLAQTERAYVTATGGCAAPAAAPSANTFGEAGVHVAPHLSVFGDVGRFHNLLPSDVESSV